MSDEHHPQFTDELLYTSVIPAAEAYDEFKVRAAFFHKDHGIFTKVTNKSSSAVSRSSYLFFLPRTSLFTGKDINQVYFKLQDLQIMHNANLHKDLSFIAFYESSNYIFMAKDIIKSVDQEIFSHKNTYRIKEKFIIKKSNNLDFKLNLS